MEVKNEKKINDNGSYTITTEKTTNGADGFVQESDLYSAGMRQRGKYRKGYTKVKSFATNDPRVTRPVAYSLSVIIAVLSPSFFTKFIGAWFVVFGIMAFYGSKRDIDRVARELEEKQSKKQRDGDNE